MCQLSRSIIAAVHGTVYGGGNEIAVSRNFIF
jgi:enoyl-CoA hydratase/carnithine racemase